MDVRHPKQGCVIEGMNFDSIIFELAVIIVGAAALGTIFLFARQPLLVAYMAIGYAVGVSCQLK
jgi:hypothetical protein